MEKLVQHTGIAVPLMLDNVDTDQIIPSREMKRVSREGLGDGLFAGWRYEYDGAERVGLNPDFILNQPEYAGASIILGGRNWGCGSSREHAVWALRDFGIRLIVAESFGRIFHGNCARNGLLAIELTQQQIAILVEQVREAPQARRISVDLGAREIHAPAGEVFTFRMPESDRHLLLNGLDFIDYTLQFDETIERFTSRDRLARPWAYLP